MRISLGFLGVLAIGLLAPVAVLAQAPGPAAPGDGASAVVWCLDPVRNVVRHDVPSACHGPIITEAEAKAIEERRKEEIAHAIAPQAAAGTQQGLHFASLGAGFYVDEVGDLITNVHVVLGCRAVQVRNPDRAPIDATALAMDQMHDLALLHAGAQSPGHVTFRSTLGEGSERDVSAIGYPNEGLPALEPQVTRGKLLRTDNDAGNMLVDIDVRHGNSGGPVVDSGGLVMGVMRAKVNVPAVYARTGREVNNTGIAIPDSTVLGFLARNRIHVYLSNGGPALSAEAILAKARTFVARVECWK